MHRTLIAGLLPILSLSWAQAAVESPAVAQRLAEPAPEHRIEFDAVDVQAELARDAARRGGGPLRYGVSKSAQRRLVAPGLDRAAWQTLDDGRLVRRWEIQVPGALSLDFLFTEFWLPHGAELYLYDRASTLVRGPFSDRHHSASGVLATPFVPGDTALIEVVAPAAAARYVKLELGEVTAAYRPLWDLDSAEKSGSCNVDVVCPEGDEWRDQIRSVARYTRSGGFLCTGQLIDNTSGDGTPYFLTANHCVSTASHAQSMVLYFNYESPTCRMPGSMSSGTPIGLGGFDDTLSGATLRATNDHSDFTLVELNQAPPASYNTFASGWDRDETPANAVTAIHHPQGDEKRISFENDPVCASSYLGDCGGDGSNWRIADWDLGTTEGGSSGSGLWNEAKRLIGQLQGGFAACGNDDPDWYGRFSVSWDFGTDSASRLKEWLDPGDTDAPFLDGGGGCVPPAVAIDSSKGVGPAGQAVTYSASVSGGQAPFSYEWDVDGDGVVDGTGSSIQARYPEAFVGDVTVDVTDALGCRTVSNFGAVVTAPRIEYVGVGFPEQVCGDDDTDIETGEVWSFPVTLTNNGDATAEVTLAGLDVANVDPREAVLAQGAIQLGSMPSGGSATFPVTAQISTQFACGSSIVIDYLGAGHAGGFSNTPRGRAVTFQVGPGGCDSTVQCPGPLAPEFLPQRGFWYNALRPGNGLDVHFAPFEAGLGIYSAWYTARSNHLPIWYYLQTLGGDQLLNDQVRTALLKFTLNGDIVSTAPTFEVIGSAKFSFIGQSRALMTWRINGSTGGEIIEFFDLDAGPVDDTLTDQYYNPAESGWGIGLHRQGDQEFSAIYFYDVNGEPSWTVVVSDGAVLANDGDAALGSFKAHCPGCVWTPAQILLGGTMSRTLNPDGTSVLDAMDVLIEGEVNIDWERTNLPLIQILPE